MLRRPVAAALLAALAFACRPDPAVRLGTQLDQELDRLDASLKKIEAAKMPEGLEDIPKAHRARLVQARAATSSDLKLYRMREAFVGVELLTLVLEQPRAAKELPAFEALWNAQRSRFEAKQPATRGPLLHRALVEASGNRAQKLYRASLPYARTSSPFSGLFYFAEGEANLRFRDFVASLPAEPSSLTPRHPNVRAELESLEQQTLQKFGGDPSARTTIGVSARLKEARELYEQNLLDGASLILLESRNHLAAQKDDTALPQALETFARSSARAAATPAKPIPQSVVVTLVRWPYT